MAAPLWVELIVLQSIIGYCFAIANGSIGIYNIKDLNLMKGDIVTVKAHKLFGRIESTLFYAITVQCIMMMIPGGILNPGFYNIGSTAGIHVIIGGISGNILFGIKFVNAAFRKNTIYKYGQILGPIGFIGWSLPHWTSLVNYYFYAVPVHQLPIFIIPKNFIISAILPIPIGLCLFLTVLVYKGGAKGQKRFDIHQIAFILHGITFGYERAARDLLGEPALFKYVVPKTYQFLETMMHFMGFDIRELESMNLNEAMDEFMKRAAKINMAEKIKVKWKSDKIFEVESINCSTAIVRSSIKPEELENAICPWAIIAATIVNKITNKDLEIEPSEFNEIGAKTTLKIKD